MNGGFATYLRIAYLIGRRDALLSIEKKLAATHVEAKPEAEHSPNAVAQTAAERAKSATDHRRHRPN